MSDEPVCIEVKDKRAKDSTDCKPGSRVGNQLFALILDRGENGPIRDKLGEERGIAQSGESMGPLYWRSANQL